MRNIRYLLFILILFLSVGFASLTTNLGTNATTAVTMADFDVYFSDAKVNGVQDITVVESATELRFSTKFSAVDETFELTYKVTNGSKNYDADVYVDCLSVDSYGFSIVEINNFDASTYLEATKSRTGVFLISLDTDEGIDEEISYTCTISAEPVETFILGEDSVDGSLSKCKWEFNDLDTSGTITPGDEYIYCTEAFNVVSSTDEGVKLFAKYNLGTNYRQTTSENLLSFSDTNGWEFSPGPKEIDIQSYGGDVKKYVNNYVSWFRNVIGYPTITGDLITLIELSELNCTITNDYGYTEGLNCRNSSHSSWLVNGQGWWTRSSLPYFGNLVWAVDSLGELYDTLYVDTIGVRPLLTVPMGALNNKKYNTYKIGTEIDIAGEKFNVIGETDTTITMLAKYNLGTNYRQSTTQNRVTFSDNYGWEYEPGPKEIDIQVWSTNPKKYVNEYVAFLQEEIGDSTLSGDLITMSKLKELGCTLHSNYSYGSSKAERTCTSSPYVDWLGVQACWTRSAQHGDANSIWMYGSNGSLNNFGHAGLAGVRPTITISKEVLNEYLKPDEFIDAQTYCENLGYSSGMLNVQTYSAWGDDEYGDISEAVYLCSNSRFEDDIVGFNALGEVVYELIANEQ